MRLRHYDFCRTDSELIPKLDRVFQQTIRNKTLSTEAHRQFPAR
jgi:hypothetical protein